MPDDYELPVDRDEMVKEIHQWLFKPQMGYPSRAEQLDNLLRITRGSKFSARVVLWLGGGGLALIGAYSTVAQFIGGAGK